MSEALIDGLTPQEFHILTVPLKDLDADMKATAVAISDKRSNFIYAENAAERATDKHKKAFFFPESAIEGEPT